MAEPRAEITVRVSLDCRARLREIADAKDISVNDVIRLAIDDFDEKERRRALELRAA